MTRPDELTSLREEIASLIRTVQSLSMQLKVAALLRGGDTCVDGGHVPDPRPDLQRRPQPPLPAPRLVRQIIRNRRLRERYFEKELFAEPGWDILLDLTAARAEGRVVSVTSLCVAAAVPPTTGLRWVTMMEKAGILVRRGDPVDRRRAFIELSDDAARAMAGYFDEIGSAARNIT